MLRQQLEDIVGTPDNWGPGADYAHAEIWKYGSFEFYFPKRGDGLIMIFFRFAWPLAGKSEFNTGRVDFEWPIEPSAGLHLILWM